MATRGLQSPLIYTGFELAMESGKELAPIISALSHADTGGMGLLVSS